MRRCCYLVGFFILGLFSNLIAWSQSDHFAYAITDFQQNGSKWVALRKVDTYKKEFSNLILDGTNSQSVLFDAGSGKAYVNSFTDTAKMFQPNLSFGGGVAAIAFDRTNNRLFFTPLMVDQLRYVDLNSMRIYCVTNRGFLKTAGAIVDPGNNLARMVIAGDGYGYTITNDGSHVFRFNTTGLPEITDLGPLKDDPVNEQTALNNPCLNAGGDMVADDAGHLFIITAKNHVYRITIQNLETRYLGQITGLPEKFTSNGAAVDEDGNIIVSSSLYEKAFYKVDPDTWKATEYDFRNGAYVAADLANSNLLVEKRKAKTDKSSLYNLGKNAQVSLYPNPTQNNLFKVQFTNMVAGDYLVVLSNMVGQNIMQKKVTIQTGSHTETIRFPTAGAKGVYMVKVVNQQNQQVFVQKLWVEKIE